METQRNPISLRMMIARTKAAGGIPGVNPGAYIISKGVACFATFMQLSKQNCSRTGNVTHGTTGPKTGPTGTRRFGESWSFSDLDWNVRGRNAPSSWGVTVTFYSLENEVCARPIPKLGRLRAESNSMLMTVAIPSWTTLMIAIVKAHTGCVPGDEKMDMFVYPLRLILTTKAGI